MIVVADASAVGAFRLPDEQGSFANYARAVFGSHAIHVPPHWPAEVASIIWKAHRRKRISGEDFDRIGRVASDLAEAVVIEAELPPGRLAAEAMRAALAAYDASFLMLAGRLGAPLLTGDGPLCRAAAQRGVKILES